VLHEFNVMDSLPEQAYEDLTKLASIICGTPIALISLVDDHRQWFKARMGLEAEETAREHAFCTHAIMQPDEVMIVQDAMQDPRFSSNPLVTSDPNIRFYAGAPLVTAAGDAIGTICVIDRQPRELTASQIETLKILAREVIVQLELRRSFANLENTVLDQKQVMDQLRESNRKMEREKLELETKARTDPLTGANNRRAFDFRLAEEFSRAQRTNESLSILMLDVDYFKAYNDSFGHPAGDEALCKIARLLKREMRLYDFLARYGGEEFAMILPNTILQGALVMGERFRRTIELSSWSHRSVTITIGVATLDPGIVTAGELVQAADRALYRAKQEGRNRVCSSVYHTTG
jgi:diguanylate cyclase (GGDEF)-like protein